MLSVFLAMPNASFGFLEDAGSGVFTIDAQSHRHGAFLNVCDVTFRISNSGFSGSRHLDFKLFAIQ
jgi:hypothetical protein